MSLKAMKKYTQALLLCFSLAVVPFLVNGQSAPVGASSARQSISTFYVGNWLLDNSMPPFHQKLAASAGKQWTVGVRSDRNLTPYMNLYYFKDGWACGNTSVWTTEGSETLKSAFKNRPRDALVVQPFGWMGLHRDRAGMGIWMDDALAKTLELDDFGDVASMAALFELFRQRHPGGELLVFEGLPPLELKRGPAGAFVLHDTGGGPAPAPDREGFDYVKHWETVKYNPAQGEDGRTQGTRDYTRLLMAELKKRFPDESGAGKVRCIPAGEVYNALEKEIRDGRIAGVPGVASFYTDTLHQRRGLPRYVLAATMYAVLFRERPHKLDWSLYNDPEAYKGTSGEMAGFYVHPPHLGEHMPIGADAVAKVNDTIWKVVSEHPYTGIRGASK